MQSISVFLGITKAADFQCKMLMSAELKGHVMCIAFFGSSLGHL